MRGLIEAGVYAPPEIVAYDVRAEAVQSLADKLNIRAANDRQAAVQDAEAVLVAVKPQDMKTALEPLRDTLTSAQTLISIAPGITTKQIEDSFSQPVPCIRVMPNTPALVGQGAAVICLGTHAEEKHRELAHRIFGAVGTAVDISEKLMDAVTGLSGSGPAYVYVFIEALSDAGVKMGLPRNVATQLAAQTVLGGAQMVLQTGQHPGVLKDLVASPGGTTIAGLHVLEQNAFRGAVMDAVQAATERASELG